MAVRGEHLDTVHERWSVGTEEARLASGIVISGVDALLDAIRAPRKRGFPDLEITLLRRHRHIAPWFSGWSDGKERELIIADESGNLYVRLKRAWLANERHHTNTGALQSHRLVINDASICDDPLWDD